MAVIKHVKMNPKLKARWVEALRSGDYKQGTKFLRTNEGAYCCLGVLNMVDKGCLAKDRGSSYPGDRGVKGLSANVEDILVHANDKGKNSYKTTSKYGFTKFKSFTFKGIANWIERNL
jgi:hypothetical protein